MMLVNGTQSDVISSLSQLLFVPLLDFGQIIKVEKRIEDVNLSDLKNMILDDDYTLMDLLTYVIVQLVDKVTIIQFVMLFDRVWVVKGLV